MHRNILPFIPYRYQGEHVPCPVCASNKHSLVARMDRRLKPLTTVMCDDCGLFYSNPMPTKDELSKAIQFLSEDQFVDQMREYYKRYHVGNKVKTI